VINSVALTYKVEENRARVVLFGAWVLAMFLLAWLLDGRGLTWFYGTEQALFGPYQRNGANRNRNLLTPGGHEASNKLNRDRAREAIRKIQQWGKK